MLRRSLLPSLAIRPASAPSYEGLAAGVQRFASLALVLVLMCTSPLAAAERTVRAVALGDSLTAGLGLPADAAFPVKLERALRAKGEQHPIENTGRELRKLMAWVRTHDDDYQEGTATR